MTFVQHHTKLQLISRQTEICENSIKLFLQHQQISDVFLISKLIHKHRLQFHNKYTIDQLLT